MRKINGIQFRAGVEKAIHKVASDLGESVSVTWSNEITTAAINQWGNILLANVADDALVDQALVWRYAAKGLHELLHRKWTSFYALRSIGDQYLHQLHNGVEDAWIENRAVREGLTGNVEQLLTVLVDSMVDQSMGEVKDWTDPRQYPFAFAVNLRLHGKTVPMAKGHEWILVEAQKRLTLCQNTAETLELARWILSRLQQPNEQPQPQPQGEGQDGEGQGEGEGEGQGEGQGEGEGEGEGEGSQSGSKGSTAADQGEGEGKGAGQPKKPESAGAAKPVKGSEKARATEPSEGVKPSGASGTYTGESGLVSAANHTGKNRTWDISITASARLRYEVKRLFENTANDEWQVNRRAGSLNVRALPKVSSSDRLFKRRLELDGVDSAVVVALDVSGSMFESYWTGDHYSSYMHHAVKAAAALLDTLHRAGVKVSLITFGSRTAVFKGFDEPLARGLSKLVKVGDGGNTNDYQAVRYAHELLARRPEARKAVFVITDGVGNEDATAAQVKSGEALGITTVGIGICLDVQHIYPKSITINNAADIGNASFKQIKMAA